MKKLFLFIIAITLFAQVFAQKETKMADNSNKLAVLWTSGDPEVAEKMGFMFAHNAKTKGWFEEVVVIIWGPSAKLLSENEMLQGHVKKMQEDGVKFEACTACANMYNVAGKLEKLGIDVKGMGSVLSDYLKSGWQTISI